MALTSQLVYKDLLQGQRHGVHEDGLQPFEPGRHLCGAAAYNKGLEPALACGVQDVQFLRQGGAFRQDQLQLGHVLLHFGEDALEQHPAPVYYADPVADVLELAQVVRGDEHRRAVLRHVLHDERPDLAAHDWVQPSTGSSRIP